MKTIYLGSDHAGYRLKEAAKKWLEKEEAKFKDFGTYSEESCDYPDFAAKVGKAVGGEKGARGLLFCGTGIGVSITANKFRGVRAALCHDRKTVLAAREHNNANILCLGARVLGEKKALELVKLFLSTPASREKRHARRVKKMDRL